MISNKLVWDTVGIVQLVERWLVDSVVAGSSPAVHLLRLPLIPIYPFLDFGGRVYKKYSLKVTDPFKNFSPFLIWLTRDICIRFSLNFDWYNNLTIWFANFEYIDDLQHRIEVFFLEGALIDYLQKKMFDRWAKQFLVFSVLIYNERYLFERISRFLLDSFLWPLKENFATDVFSLSWSVYPVIYSFFFLFIWFNIVYLLLFICGNASINFALVFSFFV